MVLSPLFSPPAWVGVAAWRRCLVFPLSWGAASQTRPSTTPRGGIGAIFGRPPILVPCCGRPQAAPTPGHRRRYEVSRRCKWRNNRKAPGGTSNRGAAAPLCLVVSRGGLSRRGKSKSPSLTDSFAPFWSFRKGPAGGRNPISKRESWGGLARKSGAPGKRAALFWGEEGQGSEARPGRQAGVSGADFAPTTSRPTNSAAPWARLGSRAPQIKGRGKSEE